MHKKGVYFYNERGYFLAKMKKQKNTLFLYILTCRNREVIG